MKEYQLLMTQSELCNRWQVSEAMLERWRSNGIGPLHCENSGLLRGINLKVFVQFAPMDF